MPTRYLSIPTSGYTTQLGVGAYSTEMPVAIIAEAMGRPRMRFVPIKTDDQLDLQSLHRVRQRWVMRRTAVINQIRGLLL